MRIGLRTYCVGFGALEVRAICLIAHGGFGRRGWKSEGEMKLGRIGSDSHETDGQTYAIAKR